MNFYAVTTLKRIELMHLLERHHNDRFTALMDAHMPQWRQYREMLNSLPLAHQEWGY